ncbi:exodeoxyribonuclease III [Candidatus Gracilibacteria bacterium]|nr:exodeoxyribonuclease III [Candidatus Gracilibacteria bacterium]
MKLISWNVNGIRAAAKKGFLEWLAKSPADVVAIQETKAKPNQLGMNILEPDGYESFWNSAERPGYSGVVTYSKLKPLKTEKKFPAPALNGEGRILLNEFENFYFLNVYFPNGKMGPHRLKFKLEFYEEFLKLAEKLRKKKPIIFCGDVNTAHAEIDLARPKENEEISGFLPIERKWIDKVVSKGYLDTFRLLNPKKQKYSWWSQRSRARERNVGWRIDYFFVSEELKKNIVSAEIHDEIMGSDHCPISLELKFGFLKATPRVESPPTPSLQKRGL